MVNSMEDKNKTYKKLKSTPANIFGLFAIIAGTLCISVGVGGYLESLNDSVSDINRISTSDLIVWVMLGSSLYFVGMRMFKKQQKFTMEDLPDHHSGAAYLTILDGVTNSPQGKPESTEYVLNSEGLSLNTGNQTIVVKWSEISETKWRYIYYTDAYQLKVKDMSYILSIKNPIESRAQARRYWFTSIASSRIGQLQSAEIAFQSYRHTKTLGIIHAFASVHSSGTTTYVSFLDRYVKKLAPPLSVTAIVATIIAGASRGAGMDKLMFPPLLIATVFVFWCLLRPVNTELKFSQLLTETN